MQVVTLLSRPPYLDIEMGRTSITRHLPEFVKKPIRPLIRPVFQCYFWFVTRNPKTFNEKVRYKQIRDKRPLISTFSDKVAARDYVRDRVGAELLTEVFGIYADPREIDVSALPWQFVLKATHGSGGIVIVWDGAKRGAVLPKRNLWGRFQIHPDDLDWRAVTRLCRQWLRSRYATMRDTSYLKVPPRILIEELLLDESGALPCDFKFYVFHGQCRAILVVRGRGEHETKDMYACDWSAIPVTLDKPRSTQAVSRPRLLGRMIEIAESLGQDTDFVRVDLYNIGDRVVFGELTNFPLGGYASFDPPDYDRIFGEWWHVPQVYRKPC